MGIQRYTFGLGLILGIALVAGAPRQARALCAQPVSEGDEPTASDCLYILKTAVGTEECDVCLCDPDASGSVVATDALLCLRVAVGQDVELQCTPCSGHTVKDDFIAELPVIQIEPPVPAGGETTTVRVLAEAASDIAVTFAGQGCGELAEGETASDSLEVTGAAGELGNCEIAATATVGDETTHYVASFTVTPTNLVLPAVQVLGGFFVPGDIPEPVGQAPAIDDVVAPGTIINGGVAELRIELADPGQAQNISQALVEVPDDPAFNGHFVVPAELDGEAIVVKLQLDPEFGQEEVSAHEHGAWVRQNVDTGDPLEVHIALIDTAGSISPTFTEELILTLVSTADVQVSLSWDTATDLDLHLVEPTGVEVYFGTPTSPAGAVLDLDSNSACGIDGRNTENITYPGVTPPPGDYTVRVDFYDNCEELAANYTVTVTVCGLTKVYTGSFAPDEADAGGLGSGREIVTFTADCTNRVRGRATYEDFPQKLDGLAKTSRMLPIRYAQVEVVRDSDNEVIGRGNTDQDGRFDVRFPNDGEPGYSVTVKAKQENDFLNQSVQTTSGIVYGVGTETIDETQNPDVENLKIEAKKEQNGPGQAFNIFDVGVEGALFVKRTIGKTPPPLRWIWQDGASGCPGFLSCYSQANGTITVQSDGADRDEYDDLVLLHEYGHFFQHEYSRVMAPGGRHNANIRVEPTLAWAEGSATFFGNLAKGTSVYLDTLANGTIGSRNDIETLVAEVPLGTSSNQQIGKVSPAVVAAILWDLADASTAEALDTIHREAGAFAALQRLKGPPLPDRGFIGPDLVDFLDTWFCLGLDDRGDANTGVQANVVTHHKFNYDFHDVAPCP